MGEAGCALGNQIRAFADVERLVQDSGAGMGFNELAFGGLQVD